MQDSELTKRVAELEKELLKWQRIRKPGHGSCCTCQRCGLAYDECRCDLDETADELEQANKRVAELERAREVVLNIVREVCNNPNEIALAERNAILTGKVLELRALLRECYGLVPSLGSAHDGSGWQSIEHPIKARIRKALPND